MALLDAIRRVGRKAGSNLDEYVGGLLGEDAQQLTDEERKQLRRQSLMAIFEAMGSGAASPRAGLERVAERAGGRIAERRQAQQQEIGRQDVQQASANIAARLGGRGVDVGEQTQLQEVRPMSGMNLEGLMGSAAGAAAMQVNPQLAEIMKQRSGMQVVGGSIYDRATGQFRTPETPKGPTTPVREVDLGDRKILYFSDGTSQTFTKREMPKANASSVLMLPGGATTLTPGDKQRDIDFAKDWSKFSDQGGFADTVKQISQLSGVLQKLKDGENITGPLVGLAMETSPALANAYLSGAVSAKQLVEDVVQRNLRVILGAQFTEKEGERLIARAYNPSLKEEENAKRLEALIQQMIAAAEAKDRAGRYFEQYGTLKGYSGALPSWGSFNLSADAKNISDDDGPAPSGVDPSLWKFLTPEQKRLWPK
jgi:hypothetical protein